MGKAKRAESTDGVQKLVDEIVQDSSDKTTRLRKLRERLKATIDDDKPKPQSLFAAFALSNGRR